jgi:thioredoxin-dependent peroxiredoxin
MTIHLGSTAPDFTQKSTEGTIHFHEWIDDQWVMLFSHPKDFTPVCTTELGMVAKLKPEFDKRRCKVLGISVDDVESHKRWVEDIERIQHVEINYPILSDVDGKVSALYDLIHLEADGALTVRAVFIIDPGKKIRLFIMYPASTGRNFQEILRTIDSLQLSDHYSVSTPVDWQDGDDVVVPPGLTDPELLKQRFPKGWKEVLPYLRTAPPPNK